MVADLEKSQFNETIIFWIFKKKAESEERVKEIQRLHEEANQLR